MKLFLLFDARCSRALPIVIGFTREENASTRGCFCTVNGLMSPNLPRRWDPAPIGVRPVRGKQTKEWPTQSSCLKREASKLSHKVTRATCLTSMYSHTPLHPTRFLLTFVQTLRKPYGSHVAMSALIFNNFQLQKFVISSSS